MTIALDPLHLPLTGSRLVEASAGTGKTWTIAALYLRLVLGHGTVGPGRPLMPGEILVMTFTKAATRELSDRIRARLVEAAAYFRGQHAPPAGDAFLARLLAEHPAGDVRARAAWRLAAAAEAMDDSAVHTIDAWCQRMLREHAFDSGCLFDEELQPNETAMLLQAARDYWRQQVYPLSGADLDTVMAQWPGLARLIEDVRPLLEMPLPEGAGHGTLTARLAALDTERAARRAALQAGWAGQVAGMRAWLEAQWARKNLSSPLPVHGRRWMDMLQAWASGGSDAALDLRLGWDRLAGASLATALKAPGVAVPQAFDELAALQSALAGLPAHRSLLRAHAAARVRERMQQLKQQAGRYGYADMLQRLDDALDETRRGVHARQLRERIVAQYPAALIDEFQDTSPRQLSIFDRVYDIAGNDPTRVLLLIGDPKQSIYGFRGADIHSYLKARRATAPRHHLLGTNRRSTQALVGAVNALFGGAESRPGTGAFLFREPGAPAGPAAGLPFEPVEAAGRAERLQRAALPLPAMTIAFDPQPANVADSREHYAALCAERIVGLLNDPATGFALDDGRRQRLRPADIAVLVRTGTEAIAIQRALRRRGLASVYLSDKDSVYQSAEAADVLRLLQAVSAPRNVRLARAALATRLFGRTLPELLALAHDDAAFDADGDRLRALHGMWQTQGVLAMLRRALHDFELPARLLADPGGEGERRLTNVLHLSELLQVASAQVEGEPALVRWLAAQIEASRGDRTPSEDLVLRLESDADLVQVVTVHKSKGLEYPLVFLPFATQSRPTEARGTSHTLHRDPLSGERRIVLAPDAADLQAHDRERLQEDLRLLYVALTRARHALWIGAAVLRGRGELSWHRSAWGYLVSGEVARTAEQIGEDLRAWHLPEASIVVETVDATAGTDPTRWAGGESPVPLRPARPYDGEFDRSWALASYSTLVRSAVHGGLAGAAQLSAGVLRDDDDEEDASSILLHPTPAASDAPWHRFPRGAFAGNFLHNQLEWLAHEGFALDSPLLQDALLRRCERQGWGHRAGDVLAWLHRVVNTSLPGLEAPLSALSGRAIPEMEFWLPADGLDVQALDALCRAHLMPGAPRPALSQRVLHGLLMGFSDLVLVHRDRYWVIDYKSNLLGATDADYSPQALQRAMLRHRYDVQAVLYLLALHRLLERRLGPHYAPERDLGGALYCFLRGIDGPAVGCHHLPPPVALLEALDRMLPRAPTEAAVR